MQHWNSFSTLYTPFQSYFLPVNHILLVRVGKSGQYWWIIVYNSLRTHDLHQYKSFFLRGFLRLNPNHKVPFERSLMEVSKEVNMWKDCVYNIVSLTLWRTKDLFGFPETKTTIRKANILLWHEGSNVDKGTWKHTLGDAPTLWIRTKLYRGERNHN